MNGNDTDTCIGDTPDLQTLPVAKPVAASDRPVAGAELILEPMGRWTALIEVLFVLVIFFQPLFYQLVLGETATSEGRDLGARIYWLPVLQGTAALALIAFVLHKGGHSWRGLGWRFDSVGRDVLAGGLGLATIYALQLCIVAWIFIISLLWPELMKETMRNRVELAGKFVPLPLSLLIPFCLFVALYEELMFRGFLLTRLRVVLGNWIGPVLIGCTIFAMGHLYEGWLGVFQVFTLAVILSGLFVLRGSILAPILVHAAFNFISLWLAPQVVDWAKSVKSLGLLMSF